MALASLSEVPRRCTCTVGIRLPTDGVISEPVRNNLLPELTQAANSRSVLRIQIGRVIARGGGVFKRSGVTPPE